MTLPDEAAPMRRRFAAEWANRTPVAWPNANFTPPQGQPWVRFGVFPAHAAQVSMGGAGNRRFRRSGLLIIEVFTPAGRGDGEANVLAEQVAAIFRGVTAEGVRYAGPKGESPRRLPGRVDGAWYQVPVHVPYQSDELA
jgi:hypothetical protein